MRSVGRILQLVILRILKGASWRFEPVILRVVAECKCGF
jgi:hypothetical protein